jgi:hypothetical protein
MIPAAIARRLRGAGRPDTPQPFLLAGLIATLLASGACSPTLPPLANTAASPEALARSVLQLVGEGNRPGLEALAVSEQEFRDHVWPDLPAARPERNLPFSYVWMDLRQKSDLHLSQTLAKHRGQPMQFIGIEFTGEVTRYRTCTVHRESVMSVRMPDGSERQLRLFGSMLEQDGRFKVFSYVVE